MLAESLLICIIVKALGFFSFSCLVTVKSWQVEFKAGLLDVSEVADLQEGLI